MITVLERSLFSNGHSGTIYSAFKTLAPNLEINFLTCPDGQVDLPNLTSTVFPLLSPHRNWRKNLQKSISIDAPILIKFLADRNQTNHAPIIIPSASESNIQFALHVLKNYTGKARFFIRILSVDTIDELSDEDRRLFVQFALSGDIKLSTETSSLTDLLEQRFGLSDISNMVLPCSVLPDDKYSFPDEPNKKQIKIGYLGDPRIEKGAEIVPEILSHLSEKLKTKSIDKTLVFTMSQHSKRFRKLRFIKYHIDLLARSGNLIFKNPKLQIERYSPFPDSVQFIKLINEMDIILLPYRKEEYFARGSGIVLDSILLNKPIIHTESMGMSNLLSAGNAKAATSAEDFADSIISMVENIDGFRDKTADARNLLLTQFQKASELLQNIDQNQF